MFLSNIELKEGAFVVCDAHYSHFRPQFLDFLKAIDSKKLKPTQIIFLGDIFDMLFYQIPHSLNINKEAIKLINKISQKIEIIYLEGNHDFNLKNIFAHAKVFPITKQPLVCNYKGKKVIFAHGDFNGELKYKIYTYIIRSSFVLCFLRAIDFISGHFVLKKLNNYLSKKDDCKSFGGFEKFVTKRLKNKYECDYFTEGHFHQNKTFDMGDFIYINLGAFACNQRYFIVKSSEDIKLLEEKSFSKEV